MPATSFKPGDRVKMVNCGEVKYHKNTVWTVESKPWNLCGTQVVLLEGYAGGFSCECLQKVANEGMVIVE